MKRYIKSINIRLITLILMFSVFSTACSVTESHVIPDVFEMEKIDLSNKKYAMIFSADIWTKNQMENGHNILLLIDDEGNWDAYHIYNLDRANISWTSDGLYFSDHTYEYFIDNEGEIFKTNKMIDLEQATAQYGSSVNTDGAVWSWFDIGFDERGGYQTRITYQYKDKSIERVVEGQYNYLFTVDNQLYGISGNFKLENAINKEGRIGLVKFTGDDLTPTVLSSHPLPDESVGPVDISQQVIVKDHIIYVIGEAEAINDQFQTNLMMWNLDDGNLEVERIAVSTDHYGGELGYYSFYTHQNALQESELYWFNERAELKRTNIQTFQTELVGSFGVEVQENLYFSARFLNDNIHMVVNDTTWGDSFKKDGTKMRIIKTSLENPSGYRKVIIKNGEELSKLFSKYSLTPTHNSFSVKPTK